MNNKDLLLERILLNMKYDSKKTLSENKEFLSDLLLEQQEIPITMNQNMQFQTWIWKNIDKLGSPDNADKNKKYNTKLCNQPCTPYNRKIQGKIYPGAIDGIFGGNTKILWNTYKTTYKKANPNWDKQDVKTDEKVLGQSIPTTVVQTKNFQKWFLEQKEKAKKDSKGLYTTKLCGTPCTYAQAVDGTFGGKTKTLWETYGNDYKKLNNLWSVSQEWSVESQKAEDLKKERSALATVFRWSVVNPSGWDGVSGIPDAIDASISQKYAKKQRQECPYYSGWDLLNTTYPKPRKYTDAELQRLFQATGGDEAYKKKLAEKNKADNEFFEKNSGRTNAGAMETGNTNQISDRLGYDRYVADPSGKGPTLYQKEQGKHDDFWTGELEKSKNKIYEDAKKWNKEYDTVVSELSTKCSSPMSFCDSQNNSNCVYVSYSDVCRKAGGIWVYNAGKNDAWCGCRSMLAPDLKSLNENMFEFNGPQGPFTKTVDFKRSLEYQTPGTGTRALEKKEETHNTLMLLELGLMGLGFVTGPFGPLFMGAAAIVGFADGVQYYQESDKHMGVMMMALSVLGVGEVAAAFKLVKAEAKAISFVSKYGDDAFKTMINTAVKNPNLLSAADQALAKSLRMATYSSQRILGKEMSKKLAQNFVKDLPTFAKQQGLGWKEFARIFWNFAETNPTLLGTVVYIVGVPYTIDKVYLALYGNDLDRQRSGIAAIIDYIGGNLQKQQEVLNSALFSFTSAIQQDVKYEQEVTKLQEKLQKGPSGGSNVKLDINALMSEDDVVEKFRKLGMVQGGFDDKRYDEIVKQQIEKEKELKDKEGCSKLSLLQELTKGDKPTWIEISKLDFLKLIQTKNTKNREQTKCGEKDYFFSEVELKTPEIRTMMDNPQNIEN